MEYGIRRLTSDDAEAYVAIRRSMLELSPFAFLASAADDVGCDVATMRERLSGGPENVIFGAFTPDLVGVVGLFRERHLKARHKMHVWGMFVAPSHRGNGAGEQLMNAALDHARSLDGVTVVQLEVSDAAESAHRLYLRLGFHPWGFEPNAICVDGSFVGEHHLALDI